MEERQADGLFRPYVAPGNEGRGAHPANPPGEPAGGAHRTRDDMVPWTTGGREPVRAVPGGAHAAAEEAFGQHPDVKRAMQAGIVPHGRGAVAAFGDRAGWRSAGEALRRNWIIATSALCFLAVGVLVAIVSDPSSPATESQAEMLMPQRTAGDFQWPPPSSAVSPAPGSALPLPPVAGLPPVQPVGDHPTGPDGTVPGAAPTSPGKAAAKPVTPKTGGSTVAPPQNATAYTTIEGEDFDGQSGVKNEPDKTGSGVHAGFIANGDWVRYDSIGFTDVPATAMVLSASNAARQNRTGQIELRLDSRSNAPIASMTIPNNGEWFAFTTYRLAIPPTTGVHTVYLTFTSTQNEEFANLDWFSFRH